MTHSDNWADNWADSWADNWGWRARIGMFIVASEAVPEAEWWAMAPAGVSVHAARVTARAPWATWRRGQREELELADDLLRGAQQFASMRLEAVVVGHSSSSILGGAGWDQALVGELQQVLPDAVNVTTNGLDCIAALNACAVAQPYLVFPPWFGDELLAAGVEYFEAHGFKPPARLRADPGRKWRDLPASELYPQGMGFEQDVESLYRQIRAGCPHDADGVLIAGTGLRCVGICDVLERDLGVPVISANQASLWHCLRLSGVRASVEGYGTLLQEL